MASNIREFNLRLKADREAIHERVGKIHRAVMLEALKRLILRTPVKTGRARSNWHASHNAPDYRTGSEPVTPDLAIARETPTVEAGQPYTISYVTNALPYIQALEDGHSKQAPEGMLEPVFNELGPWVRRIARKLESSE
jgi:hypothetical protein